MKVERRLQKVISVRVTDDMKQLIDQLVVRLTEKNKVKASITDVVVEGIKLLAKREKITNGGEPA